MATWGQGISLRGQQGVDGKRGSQHFFVQGVPTDTSASAFVGDTAFSTDLYKYYQRTDAGWGDGTLLRGPMGFNGLDAFLGTGPNPPTSDQGQNEDGVYFQYSGEIWVKTADGSWTDTEQSIVGPKGADGRDGLRGAQIYHGIGAPPSDISTLSPPGAPGDTYFDVDPNNPNRPIQYFLET